MVAVEMHPAPARPESMRAIRLRRGGAAPGVQGGNADQILRKANNILATGRDFGKDGAIGHGAECRASPQGAMRFFPAALM